MYLLPSDPRELGEACMTVEAFSALLKGEIRAVPFTACCARWEPDDESVVTGGIIVLS